MKFVPSYVFEKTKYPGLQRVVDRTGNWQYYFHKKLKRYLPSVNFTVQTGWNKGEGYAQYLLKHTKEEAQELLSSAGNKGRRVHDAIDRMIGGEAFTMTSKLWDHERENWKKITDEEWKCLRSFIAFARDHRMQTINKEFPVFNVSATEPNYAGTIDWHGVLAVSDGDQYWTVRDGKLVKKSFKQTTEINAIVDWKSGSAIHDSYYLNMAAYFRALGGLIGRLYRVPAPLWFVIVRVGTKHQNGGYEVEIFDSSAALWWWRRYESMYRSVEHKFAGWSAVMEKIPFRLAIKVPKFTIKKMCKPKVKSVRKKKK